jgi:hypothetical protein
MSFENVGEPGETRRGVDWATKTKLAYYVTTYDRVFGVVTRSDNLWMQIATPPP